MQLAPTYQNNPNSLQTMSLLTNVVIPLNPSCAMLSRYLPSMFSACLLVLSTHWVLAIVLTIFLQIFLSVVTSLSSASFIPVIIQCSFDVHSSFDVLACIKSLTALKFDERQENRAGHHRPHRRFSLHQHLKIKSRIFKNLSWFTHPSEIYEWKHVSMLGFSLMLIKWTDAKESTRLH